MTDTVFMAPVPRSEFIALARSATGKVFKKHILTKGNLIHPETKAIIKIDDAFITTLTSNFHAGICDIVQIPLADADNNHSEAPDRNIGEVIGIETEGDKVYAILDIRKHEEDIGKTLLGASAMFSQNYLDTSTGKRVGPTLLHTAVTNRPYVTGLDDYEEIVAASSVSNKENMVFLTAAPTKETTPMDLNELLDTLLVEHGINVAELQTQVTAGEAAIALSNALTTALKDTNIVKLTNGEEITGEDIIGSVVELAETNVKLSARLESLEKKDAATIVDGLVAEGRILPAQRDTYLEIKLSNSEMFDKLVPETPFVKLSHEEGVTPDPEQSADLDAEIARLTNLAAENGYVRL